MIERSYTRHMKQLEFLASLFLLSKYYMKTIPPQL